ncbi:MAG: hypothetical protein JXQ73_19595 [Phycisphaerae bacterium]|nr:hypothetical protein [Phycisphaerae bacterium]
MSEMTLNVGELPEPARGPVTELAALLARLAGPNLTGLAVFGAIATQDYSPAATLVRSVAVLKGMDLLMLDQLRRCGMRLGRRRLQAPLIMTPAYIDQSRDSFPLEFLEIQQTHVTVLGDDVFSLLTFDPRDVRLQAERELKRALINLRQGLLASAGKDKLLAPLCRDALTQILRVLRGIFWLKSVDCPPTQQGILLGARDLTQIGLSGLAEVAQDAGRSDFISFQRFYRDVERLSDYVNRTDA